MNGKIDKNSKVYIFGSDNMAYTFRDALIKAGYVCYVKDTSDMKDTLNLDDDYSFIFAKDAEEEFIIKKELLRKYKKYIACLSNGERLETVNKMLRVSGFCNKEMAMIHNPLDSKNYDDNDLFKLLFDDMKNYVPKPLDKNLKG